MIQLKRTRDPKKLGAFTGRKLQVRLGKLLAHYYDEGQVKVDFKPKGRQLWRGAKAQLKFESSNKCAYCEADTAVVAHGDVEHFRPKDIYWWLAYCYDNYNFSCQICNQSYKSTNFPIFGKKLGPPKLPKKFPTIKSQGDKLIASLCPDPSTVTNASISKLFGVEGAHLPDPYVVDPEKLLSWEEISDTKEVWVIAKSKSARAKRAAKAASDFLGLNRTELLRLRWAEYDALETMALALQDGNFADAKKRDLLARIRRQADVERPFAAMKRHYLREWGLL